MAQKEQDEAQEVQKGGEEGAKWSKEGARRATKEEKWSRMEAKRSKMEARGATEAILEAKWGAKATDAAAPGGRRGGSGRLILDNFRQ